jgi:succinate dehydrogenase / fumarate reductase flavoprotein subunit
MEVYPTCHYSMGGVRVDADSAASTVPGLFAAGEVAGGLHGANRLGGNSLSDLVVFGRRAGLHAAQYVKMLATRPSADLNQAGEAARSLLAPFERSGDENPYDVQRALQECMQEYVGIYRDEAGLKKALDEIAVFKRRAQQVRVTGTAAYNPGYHLSRDLYSMLTVAEVVTRAALERKETRGGHSRLDFPNVDPVWGKRNVIVKKVNGQFQLTNEPVPQMSNDLTPLLEEKR